MLVIAAIDANAGNELVTEAQAEGIKVITYDREMSTATADFHVSRNNYDAGRLQAEAALAFVPSGDYAIIRGDPSTIAQADMSQAYDELLKDKPGINIVYDFSDPRLGRCPCAKKRRGCIAEVPRHRRLRSDVG